MPRLTFALQTISPLFLNGADARGTPELRAPSIRGQLRYWLRALLGAQTADLHEVWVRESAVFGSTDRGSTVSVRVTPLTLREKQKYSMLPHRQREPMETEAIAIDCRFRLVCVTRPGVPFSPDFKAALSAWLLLGGVGKRSRRMFGAVRPVSFTIEPETVEVSNWWLHGLPKHKYFAPVIHDLLARTITAPAPMRGIPDFPMLHPAHSWIIVGKPLYETHEEANQALFGLLRGRYREFNRYFGYAEGQNRHASPLIAQVRRTQEGYFPVLTYMRSSTVRIDRDRSWEPASAFMRDAIQLFEAETVWGGEFK